MIFFLVQFVFLVQSELFIHVRSHRNTFCVIPPPLSSTSPSDIYVHINMAHNGLFLSLHLHSLFLCYLLVRINVHIKSHDYTCLPVCLHPPVSLPVAANTEMSNGELETFNKNVS